MTLPSQMTAITITKPGGPEVLQLQSAPVPGCGADDVLIQIAAAGVNGPDLAQRAGHYDPPPGASPLLGLEVAGVVVARGAAVTEWAIGDRVMALVNGGGYAEYVAVPAGQVLPMPAGWGFAEAAALPETWFTITQSLVLRAGLAPGMVVLVHGASGGIGGAAIQIATLLGARAIGIVSTPEKAEYADRFGALATIDRTSEDIVERVLTLTDGHGADRIIDVVGGPMAETNIAAAAIGGHIIQVSTLGGGSATLSLRALMGKQLTLSGSTLRPQSAATKAAIARRIRTDLLPALAAPDWVRPQVSQFPLADAAEAHATLEARTTHGKLVLLTPFGLMR